MIIIYQEIQTSLDLTSWLVVFCAQPPPTNATTKTTNTKHAFIVILKFYN